MKPSPRNRRYVEPLSPEEVKRREEEMKRLEKQWAAERAAERKKRERIESVLQFLEIPLTSGQTVDAEILVDILMDDEKAKQIFVKLRNKAFW